MKVDILCTDATHPVNAWLLDWVSINSKTHNVSLYQTKKLLAGGDILFLISCHEIIDMSIRSKYKNTLVVHASPLPDGRGWSPHIWQLLEGKTDITVTLLEAEDAVDSGDIWHQLNITIPKHALYDEINKLIFDAEIQLMDYALNNYKKIKPNPQDKSGQINYYPKRTPDDSRVDPTKSISEQFNLIRVCDSTRYPAYFDMHGHTYFITLEKK